MAVIHLEPVFNYEKCLESGGTHKFSVTHDEVALSAPGESLVLYGVPTPCKQIPLKEGAVWSEIVERMASRNTVCIYTRLGRQGYGVICVMPPSEDYPDCGSWHDALAFAAHALVSNRTPASC